MADPLIGLRQYTKNVYGRVNRFFCWRRPMARIPETEIERLKSEVSVQRLVEASGVELKRGGKDWLGRCPFPRGRHGQLGGESGQEPVALLRVWGGRRAD
jgi:CHC2 zinc finger